MKKNKFTLRKSKLSVALLSILAASALTACNDSNDDTTVVKPSNDKVDTPQAGIDLPPQVNLPASAPAPSNKQIAVSYLVSPANGAVQAMAASTPSEDYSKWTLKCGDGEPISPSHSDSFGPSWLISSTTVGQCKFIDASGTEKAEEVTVAATDAGKQIGLVDGKPVTATGERSTLLLEGYGLDQTNTDVKLPVVKAPGDLAKPGKGQVALQLYDPMGDYAPYDKMNLHIWNDTASECTAMDSAYANDGWDDATVVPNEVDEFGPVWYVPVTDTDKGCFKVIFRNATKDKLIGSDLTVNIATLGETKTATYMPGRTQSYASRDKAFEIAGPSAEFSIDTVGAILIDAKTLVWKGGDKSDVQIKFNHDGKYSVNDGVISGSAIKLTSTTLTDEQKAKFPHLAGYPAFEIPALNANVSLNKLLKGSMVAISSSAVDGAQQLRSATAIQYAGALDDLFAEEAKALEYGAVYGDNGVTFRLWAPTASDVDLVIYGQDKQEITRVQMIEDAKTGSWSLTQELDSVDKKYYRYAMKVFQPREQKGYGYEVTDPYSVSLSTNSIFSQAINLSSDELKPSGWDALQSPHSQKDSDLSDMVIYESHVRDFSSLDNSTQNKGKYLAFTESGTTPTEHLKQLSEAGMTHLHLLPVFDIATINEDPSKVADINEPFSKLCTVNPATKSSDFAKYCDSGSTIAEVFEEIKASDSKETPKVQDLNELVRGVDSYNWGYDPLHYTVPEGSYASNAEGSSRILEFRQMVQSVKQDIKMNVVMDVVYNHTNDAGLGEKSVLDKIVPLYYQRLVPDTGAVTNSTCCSNTAPEHEMFAKMIDDSIKTWTKEYKIDAFRWDLMGHHPLAQMKGTLEAAKTVNPEVYFYGEGWNFGEVQDDKRFVQATQKHLGGTGIGSFSDRLRDAVRGGSPFDGGEGLRKTQGFATGAYVLPNELAKADADELKRALHQIDLTRLGMAGNLKSFEFIDKDGKTQKGSTLDYNGQKAGYAEQPWEVQNYVSKHDNQTFWDINMYKVAKDVSPEVRVKMQSIGMATVLLGQAMPFNHMGGELLRSKSMQRDSYDYGDWYNKVDFTLNDNNWNKGLPAKEKDADNYDVITDVLVANAQASATNIETAFAQYKELLTLRKSSPLMTLPTGKEIISRVDFKNTGATQTPGLIVMTIDNGSTQATDLDASLDAIVVMINATPSEQSFSKFSAVLEGFELSSAHRSSSSIAEGASFTNGTFVVPAWGSAVFVQPRNGNRGEGIAVSKKDEVPPFGYETKVYVAGSLNEWKVDGTLASFTGNGRYSVDVTVGANTEYKFTLGDWDKANWGCGSENCKIAVAGKYRLTLDASVEGSPKVLDAVKM